MKTPPLLALILSLGLGLTGAALGRWLQHSPTAQRVQQWLFGSLLIGFAVMGGRDLGAGTLLPFVARTDAERRVVINVIGPTWEGNQVWLVLLK